jgi:hypothetical protein
MKSFYAGLVHRWLVGENSLAPHAELITLSAGLFAAEVDDLDGRTARAIRAGVIVAGASLRAAYVDH